MPKIAPSAPQERSLLRDLDEVIRGHLERLDQYQVDRATPVVSPEAADLMLRTMIRLLSEVIMEGRGRRWAPTGETCFGFGGGIDIVEARTEARAKFLLAESSFSLFLVLDRAPFIGRARDSFWADITSLGNLALEQLAFHPYAIPMSMGKGWGKVPIRPGHAVGELMRYWHQLRAEGDPLVDFGELEVSWPLGTPLESLLPAMSETLETFYRIAYELYRLERQTKKRE